MAAPPPADDPVPPPPAAVTSTKPTNPTHRLPTVSASQALQELEIAGPSHIPTGIASVDAMLSGPGALAGAGGFERGKVVELWGPKGAGKTAIALQASVHAIESGRSVVWVDCGNPVSRNRLQVMCGSTGAHVVNANTFCCFSISTLAHLTALVLRPPPSLFAADSALFVISAFDLPLSLSHSRQPPHSGQKPPITTRHVLLSTLASALSKLAALHNLAVVLTTSCALRSRAEQRLPGALVPVLGGSEWDAGIWNRLVVFRDFDGRFLGVQKANGRSLISRQEVGETGRLVGFEVDCSRGVVAERVPTSDTARAAEQLQSSPVRSRKRLLDEVADSDGEEAEVDEFGWVPADEDVFAAGGTTTAEGVTDAVADAESLP